ncbi:MAG: 5-(carboxyamino)imidazole ribonucleotide mutase, partial [Anaerolineales bacterium]|nr:5-(carboxyamino)imidazole ribonucleotide mutase [Anaerolineales bacterium]
METQPPLVVIVMGSRSDAEHCEEIATEARRYGLQVVMRIASAHKTAAHSLEVLQQYERASRPRVYITVAGRSNALSGFVDGAVNAPVIACPPASQSYAGADLFSSLRMPSGIAPGVVLEARNAALLAA